MRILKFNDISNLLKLEPESFDDIYLLAMIIGISDNVEAKSSRRFRSSEKDIGEQKDVVIKINVEKIEIDKTASRLRLTGKIIEGRPEEFVNIGSYHTINIGERDIIEIQKSEWKEYILKRIKQAVIESKKPRLGVIAIDDEKATVSYIKGYGIDILTEIYSHLSKRMKEKDYEKQRTSYFNEVITLLQNMKVDIVIIGGPGFVKDDIKKYISDLGIEIKKRLFYASASDAERSGIREIMQSDVVVKIVENEHVKKEFGYLNRFLEQLRFGKSLYGVNTINEAINSYLLDAVLVNDSILNQAEVKNLLDKIDMNNIHIEIFNSEDDAGIQLKNFKDIAAIIK